jgi:hypothetical protein
VRESYLTIMLASVPIVVVPLLKVALYIKLKLRKKNRHLAIALSGNEYV